VHIKLYKVLSDIENSINEASSHCEVWWALGFSENRDKYRDIFEDENFNAFLHTSYIANQTAMIMAISRAFDSSETSSQMRELKKLLSEANMTDLVIDIENELLPHQSLVKRILDIRCQLIAHTQTDQTNKSVLKRNGIKPKEIKGLIESTKSVLIKIAFKLRVYNLCYTQGLHNNSTLNVLAKLKV
jgi:hypothetical protein